MILTPCKAYKLRIFDSVKVSEHPHSLFTVVEISAQSGLILNNPYSQETFRVGLHDDVVLVTSERDNEVRIKRERTDIEE